MELSYNDYITIMESGEFNPIVRILILQDGNEDAVYDEITRYVIDGSISMTNAAGVRTSANLVLQNVDKRLKIAKDYIWLNTKLLLYVGIQKDGAEFLRPKGIFTISDPEQTSSKSDVTINLKLQDKWSLLDGSISGVLGNLYEIPRNTDINYAIQRVLQKAGDTKQPILESLPLSYVVNIGSEITKDTNYTIPVTYTTDSSTLQIKYDNIVLERNTDFIEIRDNGYRGNSTTIQFKQNMPIGHTLTFWLTKEKAPYLVEPTTPYTIRKNYSDTYASLLQDLANINSRLVYYDSLGRLRCHEDYDDLSTGSSWDYSTKEVTYLGATRQFQTNKLYNRIVVIGASVEGHTVYGEAINNDLMSDTCVQLIGYRTKPPINANQLNDDKLAAKLALFHLKRTCRLQDSISATSIPLVHLEPNDIVTISDDAINLDGGRYVIQNLTYPLTGKGEQSITLWKETISSAPTGAAGGE